MKYKIKVKKYNENNGLSWEEKYKELERHHIEEVAELMATIEVLETRMDNLTFENWKDWYD